MSKTPDGWIDRLNYVAEFLFDPCDAPFSLYVRTALPAALEAILIYLEFNPKDMFVNWVRPARAISRQRSRKKASGRGKNRAGNNSRRARAARFLGSLTAPNETAGKHLPGADLMRGRKVSNLLSHLWIFHDFGQRILWWILVIELITLFLYRWASLLRGSRFCSAQGDTVLLARNDSQVIFGGGQWTSVVFPEIEKIRGRVTWNHAGGSFSGDNGRIVVGIPLYNDTGVPDYYEVRIMSSLGGPVAFGGGEIDAGTSAQLVLDAQLPKGIGFHVQIRLLATFSEIRHPTISVWGDTNRDED